MIDALYPDSIPAGTTCDAIAAYIDHNANPDSFAQAQARFPDALHVKISAHAPGTVGADVLDVEPGTYITPQHAVDWVVKSRAAGIDPTVYCNQLDRSWGWPAVRAAFAAANVPEPHWWVANYDLDPTIPDGALGKQYTDLDPSGRNTYDTSNMTAIPGHLEDYMTPEQDAMLRQIAAAVSLDQTHPGAPSLGATFKAARDGIYDSTHPSHTVTLAQIAALSGKIDGLTAALKQAGGGTVDLDAVRQAAEQGTLAALGQYQLTLTPAQGTGGGDLVKGAQ